MAGKDFHLGGQTNCGPLDIVRIKVGNVGPMDVRLFKNVFLKETLLFTSFDVFMR